MGYANASPHHRLRPGILTIIAISVLAYILSNVVHEGLGHGATCRLVGGQARIWTASEFDCACESLPSWKFQLMSGGGASANLLASLVGSFLLLIGLGGIYARFFLWLFSTVNILQFGGYLMFLYPFGKGDGEAFARSGPAVKATFFVVGLGAYLAGIFFARRTIEEFLEGGQGRRKSILALTVLPYVAGSLAICLGGALNPAGIHPAVDYAAQSTFFATFGLTQLYVNPDRSASSSSSARSKESAPWIVAAITVLAAYVGILGPGIHL